MPIENAIFRAARLNRANFPLSDQLTDKKGRFTYIRSGFIFPEIAAGHANSAKRLDDLRTISTRGFEQFSEQKFNA